MKTCEQCGGLGIIECDDCLGHGFDLDDHDAPCPECGGATPTTCDACDGQGEIMDDEEARNADF